MKSCCSEVSRRITVDAELEGGSKNTHGRRKKIGKVMARNEPDDNCNSNKWLRGSKYCSDLVVAYGCQCVLRQDERHNVTHITTTG